MVKSKVILFCIAVASLAMASMATIAEDEKDCADQLANLAACIPFVSGDAKKPTPQCCEDIKKVKANKPKCLCVLIKESTDPSLGLPVNTTLALQMPAACNIDAQVSDCPTILKLPADSPDAKIFKAAGTNPPTTTTTDSVPASGSNSPETTSSSSPSSSGSDSKATPSSNNGAHLKLSAGGSLLALMALVTLVFV